MKKNKAKVGLYLIVSLAILSLFTIFGTQTKNPQKTKSVAVIIPLEHQALNDIYLGFEKKLRQELKDDVSIKLFNAQGDINLEQAMLKQAVQQDFDLIIPITTKTTQMAASLGNNKKIIFLAANIAPESSLAKQSNDLTGVIDQIPSKKILEFIKISFPHVRKIALVHSSSDKIYQEVEDYKKIANQHGLVTYNYMIQTLAELYPMTKSIAQDVDMIFILKDNLIASGVDILVREANKRKIPLLTSDEGTVKKGAHISLGVKESDIGRAGAIIASQILQGKSLKDFPIQYLNDSVVFLNSNLKDKLIIQKNLLASGYKVETLIEERS